MARARLSPVREVLTSHGGSLTEEYIAELLEEHLTSAPMTQPATAADLAFLSAHVPGPEFTPERGRAAVEHVAAHTSVYDATMTLSRDEIARDLGVSPTTVSHRVRGGRLLSWRTSPSTVRYPAWQVIGGQELPHLREVLAAVPEGAHPREVTSLMTAPDPDLDGASPSQWLAAGGDPGVVIGLVAGLGRG